MVIAIFKLRKYHLSVIPDTRMTLIKEEILSEPAGRVMDSWVAENVFGYKVYKSKNPFDSYDKKLYDMVEWDSGDGVFKNNECLQEYSSNISCAWLVVEKVGQDWIIENSPHVKIYGCGRSFEDFIYMNGEYDETVSLAICKAALVSKL